MDTGYSEDQNRLFEAIYEEAKKKLQENEDFDFYERIFKEANQLTEETAKDKLQESEDDFDVYEDET
jgi:hypothetical protein